MGINYSKHGNIALFTINNPHLMNALDIITLAEFHEAIVDFRDDPEIWGGIITGTGEQAFCTGIDIRSCQYLIRYQDRSQPLPATLMPGLEMTKPLIAAINGLALGGGLELAFTCDIRIATENARLGTPEIKLGLTSGWGGTQRLPRQIHWCQAAEMLLSGKIIGAYDAQRIGLIDRIVPQEQLFNTAMEWANAFCNSTLIAVRSVKDIRKRRRFLPQDETLDLEGALETYLKGTDGFYEGLKFYSENSNPFYRAK